MKSEKLKLNIAQRVLNLSDDALLKKISTLLDAENIIGYDAEGNPVSDSDYIQDVNSALLELKEESLKVYSHEEVKRRITGK